MNKSQVLLIPNFQMAVYPKCHKQMKQHNLFLTLIIKIVIVIIFHNITVFTVFLIKYAGL